MAGGIDGAGPEGTERASSERRCGECSLCCTLLRVDDFRKLGGTACEHQRSGGGCSIHAQRPPICRAYHCLWRQGGLRDGDRPDRLGALLDLENQGGSVSLSVRMADASALGRSARLREVVEEFRASMPVRLLVVVGGCTDEGEQRLLLPGGDELRREGDRLLRLRAGAVIETTRRPWLERGLRAWASRWRRWRLRGYR